MESDTIEKMLNDSLQQLRRMEEESRKKWAKEEKKRNRRCYLLGNIVLRIFPSLEHAPEEEALKMLEGTLYGAKEEDEGQSHGILSLSRRNY